MPLEATMMIIDNSDYMRNGDYTPSRYEAQADAVNSVFSAKIDSNPENTVGVMSMAGKAPQVLVTHTKEQGQILDAIHKITSNIGGSIDIPTAIAIAQLALKHRENKNLRQRIIVFVGSPLEGAGADEKAMVKLAKKLKKNNVSVDIIAFGDGIEEETNVLKAFVEAAASADNSHFLSVVPGPYLLSDSVNSSPILAAERGALADEAMGGGEAVAGGSGSNDFEFGVDPALDPELAAALRASMQDSAPAAPPPTAAATTGTSSAAPAVAAAAAATGAVAASTTAAADDDEEDEDAMLAQALALSAQDAEQDVDMGDAEDEDDEDEDEEAAIARAIEMSMKGEEEKKK